MEQNVEAQGEGAESESEIPEVSEKWIVQTALRTNAWR